MDLDSRSSDPHAEGLVEAPYQHLLDPYRIFRFIYDPAVVAPYSATPVLMYPWRPELILIWVEAHFMGRLRS